MANAFDYRDEAEVRAAFKVSFDFEPIPASASFRGLLARMLDKLSRNLKAKQQRMVDGASRAMWREIHERVAHILNRLTEREANLMR